MNFDFAKLAEAIKDKVGRKQIIAMTTIICLTYLAAKGITDIKVLLTILGAGIVGMGLQSLSDWKNPRQEKPEKPPTETP